MTSFSSSLANPDSGFSLFKRSGKIKLLRRAPATPLSITAASLNDDNQNSSTKLLTFLGKDGFGKTTSAVFAAQCLSRARGVGSGETLRMIGAASKASYLVMDPNIPTSVNSDYVIWAVPSKMVCKFLVLLEFVLHI
ncbi:hypothetical protein OIU84_021187 [Salix udensis]|uniref:Uncharacterized protein n=1 Tax=Salix udensis TaxID=889485 RepID=A0AAD6KVK8_9ROSI|nr:hypothetical protein OIU84_021187 [Salix udensis]